MDKAIKANISGKGSHKRVNLISNLKEFFGSALGFEKPAEDAAAIARRELLRDLEETLSDLRYARSCFENAKDPEVIEACVYEIKSAETRYSFLLRKAKLLGEKSSKMSV